MRNLTKDRLKAGKIAFGFQVRSSRSLEIVRMAAKSNYHFVNIDLEHSTITIDMAAQFCAACLSEGISSIVRVPGHSPEIGARLLDAGAQGLIIPHVHTAETARKIVRQYRVPPIGERSEGGSGIMSGWAPLTNAETFKMVNENTLVAVMAESAEALENIEDIAAVEGVDVIVVGTNDLAADLGISPDSEHPKLLDAYKKVMAAANRNGKAVRLGGLYDSAFLLRTIELGSRMVTVTGDTRVLIQGMRSSLKSISELAGSAGIELG